MTQYRVFIEAEELKNVSKEDIEAFKAGDQRDLENKFIGSQERSSGDTVEYKSETTHDSKEEAMARYNEIKANEFSTFYWGNNLLTMRRVCIEEIEVDEDGDVMAFGDMDWDWLEIN